MDGIWTFVGIGLPVTASTGLLLMAFIVTDVHLGGGLAEARRQLTPWLSVAPGFLVAERPVAGGRAREWRYRFDVTLYKDAGPVRLAWRSLLERRLLDVEFDGGPSTSTALTVLRNRFRVDLPFSSAGGRPAPFVAAEAFRDLSAGVNVQLWLMAGLSLDAGPGLRLESYYLRRVLRDAQDGDALAFSLIWRP